MLSSPFAERRRPESPPLLESENVRRVPHALEPLQHRGGLLAALPDGLDRDRLERDLPPHDLAHRRSRLDGFGTCDAEGTSLVAARDAPRALGAVEASGLGGADRLVSQLGVSDATAGDREQQLPRNSVGVELEVRENGKRKVVGEKVVIVGGELVACEVAEYLAEKGKKITMVRRGSEIAQKIGTTLRAFTVQRLRNKVNILTGVTYNEANEKGLVVTTREGEKKLLEADTIVIAAGAEPDQALYQVLKGKVAEVRMAGDCVSPRNIADAVADGYWAGLNI